MWATSLPSSAAVVGSTAGPAHVQSEPQLASLTYRSRWPLPTDQLGREMHLIDHPWSYSVPSLPPHYQEGNCRGKHGHCQASRETAQWGLGPQALAAEPFPNVPQERSRPAPWTLLPVGLIRKSR